MKINCINFSFSAHLHYMQTAATSQGDELGMKYWNPFDKINMIRTRQVILTRQTTSHSGLALSETDWESASVGLRKRNPEESDLGYSVKKFPKEWGSYSFWCHTSMNQNLHSWQQRTTCWFQLLPLTIFSYTWFCQVSQLLVWVLKFAAIPPPSPTLLFHLPNSSSPSKVTRGIPHQVSTSKSPQSSSLHGCQTKCNIISHLSLPSLPDLWFLFQEFCKGAPLINPPSMN